MIQQQTYFGFDSYATNSGIDYAKLVNDEISHSNAAASKTQEFIDKHKNDVIRATEGTGLFPSVKMAQMIIESSWGKGITAKEANNYFGIKADKGWTGNKKLFNTPRDAKKQNYFRVYPTALDSIKDHTKFLQVNSRYPKGGVFSATTPEQQIRAIAKAGYAEAGKYDEAIIKLINAYNLKSLDGVSGYKVIENPKTSISVVLVFLGLAGLGFYLYKKNKLSEIGKLF